MEAASSTVSATNMQPQAAPIPVEKPHHAHYLNDFRVEPCALFKQHQCQQHRPYTCFNWHFANQRRRRPIRKPDGSFNYSADIYCDKYDENTGICPDGDNCPLLHRVSGDVERKYHLRYFKTAQCVHGTDARGNCVKNGQHCAFAHSVADLRQPLHDPNEGQLAACLADSEIRDRTAFVIEDPLWHSQDHVLSCYKTEQCRKPARLCRQGYACPYYHNSKDRRRPPAVYKYRSTPCPAAKSVDEWLDPDQCEAGDACGYCHTRTEQQFHPEIYKSTKCNDMLEYGYCPRAVFCAFAHHDSELHTQRTPYVSPPTQNSPKEQQSPQPKDGQRFSPGSANFNGQNGPATPSYSAILKQRQPSMPRQYNSPQKREEMISSSYPKAPGFERGPLSPNHRETGRVRTSSLNMGQLDLGCTLGNGFDAQLGTSLPSQPIFSRSDSGFHAMSSTLEELSLDLTPIDEQREQRLLGDLFSNNPLGSSSSPLRSDTYQQAFEAFNPLASPPIFSPYSKPPMTVTDELAKAREDLAQKIAIWEESLKQARQACEAWRNDAEHYKRLAEKVEHERIRAVFERDQALKEVEALRNELLLFRPPQKVDLSDSLLQPLSSSLKPFNVFSSPIELPVCARCGRDRLQMDSAKYACPLCSN